MPAESPFDRYDIDPAAPAAVITERFRELVAEAREEDRDALRAEWDSLTLHPEGRVRAAFLAHPETRAPLGEPPRRRRARVGVEAPEPSLLGLLCLPELAAVLPPVEDPDLDLSLDPVLSEA